MTSRHMLSCAAGLVGIGICTTAAPAGFITIAHTSFEEPGVFGGVQYTDTLDPLTDHALLDNPGEPWVNWTGTDELGFSSFYFNTRDGVGLTDGDFVGVTDFTGDVGAYTDGVQGFQMSDPDGAMRTSIEMVDLSGAIDPSVAIDLFINETGWESDDSIRVWVESAFDGETVLLDTTGSDIDDLGIEDSWLTLSADLSATPNAVLHIELDANSGSEAIYVDNVRYLDIPGPGAIALLGLAGLVGRRRRR